MTRLARTVARAAHVIALVVALLAPGRPVAAAPHLDAVAHAGRITVLAEPGDRKSVV